MNVLFCLFVLELFALHWTKKGKWFKRTVLFTSLIRHNGFEEHLLALRKKLQRWFAFETFFFNEDIYVNFPSKEMGWGKYKSKKWRGQTGRIFRISLIYRKPSLKESVPSQESIGWEVLGISSVLC